MHTSFNRAALACALLASTALASPAFAQNTPPPFPNSDENGVDLTTGKFTYSLHEASIGSGDGAVSLSMVRTSGYYLSDNWTGAVYTMVKDGTTFHVVDLGTSSDSFTYNGSSFTPTKSDGGKLELVNGAYRYTTRDASWSAPSRPIPTAAAH